MKSRAKGARFAKFGGPRRKHVAMVVLVAVDGSDGGMSVKAKLRSQCISIMSDGSRVRSAGGRRDSWSFKSMPRVAQAAEATIDSTTQRLDPT